jgi:signal peptidase I
MSEVESNARKPWIAVALALFSSGLGHIYCGKIVPGLVLFLLVLVFAPLVVLAATLQPSTPVLVALLASALGLIGVMLFGPIDAYRLARRLRERYEPKEFNRGLIYGLFLVVGLTYPAGIIAYLRANIFEAFYIPTASMVPNILEGDHVLVNKTIFQYRFPRRGDVVVFHVPSHENQRWVKRVIALPGDTVAVRANQVFVNGKKLERDPVPAAALASIQGQVAGEVFYENNAGSRYMVLLEKAEKPIPDFAEAKVPEGTCFVLGDNRNRSSDSRDLGFVPLQDLFGVVQYIYLPAESWGRFGSYEG